MSSYPARIIDRNAWILAKRGPRASVNPEEPYAYFVENERSSSGQVVPVATVFLTNRECPWKCVMCDLWKNTLAVPVRPGALPAQIDFALARLPQARQIKLYNSGSFFDQGAVPLSDLPAIASQLQSFERVIVECHPALVGASTLQFRDLLAGRLEVAIGLETAHPEVLAKLNKAMTLQLYSQAATFLCQHSIDMRSFVLVQPPFLPLSEGLTWAKRSIDFSFQNGATAVTLIPTRGGNGAMEALAEQGEFVRPSIRALEEALDYGIHLKVGRVFADLWDIQRSNESCATCFAERLDRLQSLNLSQNVLPKVNCSECRSDS